MPEHPRNAFVESLSRGLLLLEAECALSGHGIVVLATLLCAAVLPALAGWGRVGSVEFSMSRAHESVHAKFEADSIALTARDGDVFCSKIRARFDNNRTRTILHNVALIFEKAVNVDFPGGVRHVKQLDFDCWSIYRWRTRVDITASTVS
jgi:hypothetical protein